MLLASCLLSRAYRGPRVPAWLPGIAALALAVGTLGGCSDATHTVATFPLGSDNLPEAGQAGGALADDQQGTGGTGSLLVDDSAPIPTPVDGQPDLCDFETSVPRMDALLLVDTYITLPFTGSLGDALDGIEAYVNDPRVDGSGAGTIFVRTQCDAGGYDPPDAEMGLLRDNAAAIVDSFPTGLATTITPITPALIAATTQARQRIGANPQRKQIIVLASDGLALGASPCGLSSNDLEVAARDAFTGTPSIPVYVIELMGDAAALGTLQNNMLQAVAIAGGTTAARPVFLRQSYSMEAMLHQIRTEAQLCEYAIPAEVITSESSLVLNYGASEVVRVSGPSGCLASTSGVYVNDAGAPTALIACAVTCGRIRRSGGHESVRVRGPCPDRS